MQNVTSIISTVTAAFLGSFVEVVEAFTIVLAVGITNTWRSAFMGTAAGLLVLVALVLVFGPLLQLIPIGILQFVVGVLLGLFGMRWLRKAILRASGYISLHDEGKIFSEEVNTLNAQKKSKRAAYLAAIASFKAVLLEGIEVVFIVIAVGAREGLMLYAGMGALLACLIVLLVGLALHRPLTQIPENLLKLAVGVMLTAFSVFWIGEAMGVEWPGNDLVLLPLIALIGTFTFLLIRLLSADHKHLKA